jgi:hypothetical protein
MHYHGVKSVPLIFQHNTHPKVIIHNFVKIRNILASGLLIKYNPKEKLLLIPISPDSPNIGGKDSKISPITEQPQIANTTRQTTKTAPKYHLS